MSRKSRRQPHAEHHRARAASLRLRIRHFYCPCCRCTQPFRVCRHNITRFECLRCDYRKGDQTIEDPIRAGIRPAHSSTPNPLDHLPYWLRNMIQAGEMDVNHSLPQLLIALGEQRDKAAARLPALLHTR